MCCVDLYLLTNCILMPPLVNGFILRCTPYGRMIGYIKCLSCQNPLRISLKFGFNSFQVRVVLFPSFGLGPLFSFGPK